jgi:hypothetical protein
MGAKVGFLVVALMVLFGVVFSPVSGRCCPWGSAFTNKAVAAQDAGGGEERRTQDAGSNERRAQDTGSQERRRD